MIRAVTSVRIGRVSHIVSSIDWTLQDAKESKAYPIASNERDGRSHTFATALMEKLRLETRLAEMWGFIPFL
jgi:hypothetical protein